MTIFSMIKTVLAGAAPGPTNGTPTRLKSLVAAGAVAWGTQTALKMAGAAVEQATMAEQHLAEVEQAIEAHTAALNAISGQNKEAREAIIASVIEGFHAGMYDHVVMARATALGWYQKPHMPFVINPEFLTEPSPERSDLDQPNDIGEEDQADTPEPESFDPTFDAPWNVSEERSIDDVPAELTHIGESELPEPVPATITLDETGAGHITLTPTARNSPIKRQPPAKRQRR